MTLTIPKYVLSGLLFSLSITLIVPVQAKDDEIVVYSARKEHLIKPLFDAYTQNTGVKIKFITAKAGALLERLTAEGEATNADMLMTVDAGNLWQAAKRGVLQAVNSEVLANNIPAYLHDPDNHWFGLSVRARSIMYSTERVKPEQLSTYADLADPKWKGQLCLRTSKKVYNKSLVAMMITRLGEAKTEEIVKGWVDNLATDVFSSDTKLLEAIAAGQCDVGITNTYYLGRLKAKDAEFPVAPFWQTGTDEKVHVNISGAGITAHAKNAEAAIKLLEWLSGPEAQGKFAGLNHEYPVNPEVKPSDLVAAWGEYDGDKINVSEAGRLQADAIMLMDRAGYK